MPRWLLQHLCCFCSCFVHGDNNTADRATRDETTKLNTPPHLNCFSVLSASRYALLWLSPVSFTENSSIYGRCLPPTRSQSKPSAMWRQYRQWVRNTASLLMMMTTTMRCWWMLSNFRSLTAVEMRIGRRGLHRAVADSLGYNRRYNNRIALVCSWTSFRIGRIGAGRRGRINDSVFGAARWRFLFFRYTFHSKQQPMTFAGRSLSIFSAIWGLLRGLRNLKICSWPLVKVAEFRVGYWNWIEWNVDGLQKIKKELPISLEGDNHQVPIYK